MARDTVALPIQGSDNGTGNPILVTTTATETVRSNLVQVAGNAVVTAAAGVQRVSVVDTFNNNIQTSTTGDTAGATRAARDSSTAVETTGAVNTNTVFTLAAVAGQQRRLNVLSMWFEGANAAVIATVDWGGTVRMRVPVPAAQNSLLQVNLPEGGIGSGAAQALTITLPAGGAGTTGHLNTSILTW